LEDGSLVFVCLWHGYECVKLMRAHTHTRPRALTHSPTHPLTPTLTHSRVGVRAEIDKKRNNPQENLRQANVCVCVCVGSEDGRALRKWKTKPKCLHK